MSVPVSFNGSIPRNYEDYLGNLLFEDFATDLASRLKYAEPSSILELAAGTGCVTKHLLQKMGEDDQLTATDLEQDMLDIAMAKIRDNRVSWSVTDMTAINFPERSFDAIVCQFGVMLVPNQTQALREMFRVLKPGGRLMFSVWSDIQRNPIWSIGGAVIASFLGVNPIGANPGPFSMKTEETLALLQDAGFSNANVTIVKKSGTIATAAMAARGFVEGLPVYPVIMKRDPMLVSTIQAAMADRLALELGDDPLITPLEALVFEALR